MSAVAVMHDSFYYRSELEVFATELVAEKVVEFCGVLGCDVVDDSHGVPLYAVAVKHVDSVHHFVPGGLSVASGAVCVVHRLWPIDADACEPAFLV